MVYKSSSIAAGGSSGTGGGIVSINSDTTAAQVISAGAGISVSTASGTTTITNTGSGSVSSVFGRTGAVSANSADYAFNLISGTAAVSQGGTGQASLTAHSVLLGEGAVTGVGFATTGIAGRLLVDQGGIDPAFKAVTGDISILSTGATTVAAIKGTTVSGTTGSTNVVFSASPALTGIPTTPTAVAATGGTQIASQAYADTSAANAALTANAGNEVDYASAAKLPNSPIYNNGVSGIGATITTLTTNTGLVVDGTTVNLGDEVLVKNEGDSGGLGAAKNGIYSLTTVPALGVAWILTRNVDYDMPSDINYTGAIYVKSGSTLSGNSYVLITKITTVGTDALTYTLAIPAYSTIITTSTAAGGSLAGTYPNPTLAVGAISGGTSISISNSGSVTGITYSGAVGGVSSVTNTDGSLTISPGTGAVVGSLNTAHANTWTATQTSNVSGGVSSFISTGCIEFSIFANGNSGNSSTIKWDNGNIQSVTISGAASLAFTAPTHPGRLTLIATQDGTGHAYSYTTKILWASGTVPTWSSGITNTDIASFLYDGANYYGIGNTNFF